jgi:ubiquinone/menaquinone biosynthesis C-methylase UbiE
MARKTASESAFEKYAHEYDWMTNASQRETYHSKEVEALIDRFQPRSVLDAGCATGLTARLFAERGVKAVGLDRSPAMLREARKKYGKLNLPLSFHRGEFARLPKALHGRFDLVVCLANAITGVDTLGNLLKAMKNFNRVLSPGGALVIQMLNYRAVKEGVFMPIRSTENNGVVYARYSERQGKTLFINLVRVDLNQNPPTTEPFRHSFDNFAPKEVTTAIREAGFRSLNRYNDLYLKDPFTAANRDFVVTALKK